MGLKVKKDELSLNLIFNIIYNVIVVLSPLIITPKISRVFGAELIGVKSYTYSIVYYFSIFGVLGLDLYGQRKIAHEKDDINARSKTFWTIFTTRFMLTFSSTLIYLLSISFFSSNALEYKVFLCWTIFLVREMINPVWYLQGIEKYKIISCLSIISQVFYVLTVFLFVNKIEDLPLYVLLFTVIPLAISIIFLIIVIKNVKFIKFKFSDMVLSVKGSFVYFIPAISTAVYSMIDKTMLGIYDQSKISTGLYESAEKLIKVALAFSTASFTIIRTRMSYLHGKNNKDEYTKFVNLFISFTMLLCWPIMFGIIGISKDFVPLFFGNGFESVINLSYWFSFLIPCISISGLLQAIYIFPYGLQKTMDIYYLITACLNVLFNLLLISLFGIIGAILASILAELFLAIILMNKSKKEIKIFNLFKQSIKYIASSSIMLIFILFISNILNTSLVYKVIIEVLGGVTIYFIFCVILKDKFIIDFLKNIKKRFKSV